MVFTEFLRFRREHSILFGLLLIGIISVLAYTTLRDFVSYILPFDYFGFVILLVVIMVVVLVYLYETEVL